VTSFAASRVFSRSVDVTKAHDMTLAGGASFNGGIFLAVAVVDRALKGSMVGERINKSFGRELSEKAISWGIYREWTLLFLGILPFHNTNVELSMGGMQWEKTPSRKGFRGRTGAQQAPKNSIFFPKKPLINHSIHSYPWFWKFGKKNLKRKFWKREILI
jgi:hypothetical protein